MLFYRQSIAFADHSYHFHVIHIVSKTIHRLYRSFLLFKDCTYRVTPIYSFLRSFILFPGHPYRFHPSIVFTNFSYHLQVISTMLQAIHSIYISFIPFTGCPYHFTDHPYPLQIIPTIDGSSIPFLSPLMVFTDHSYHL